MLAPPEFGEINRIKREIEEIDRGLYDILAEKDASGRGWYLPIEKKDEELRLREEAADALYESIGPTEVIKKGIGSNLRPVGKYADVLEMRKTISEERRKLDRDKAEVSAFRGGFVDDEEVKQVWQKRLPLAKELQAYEEQRAEYLKTPEARWHRFHGHFYILGIVCLLLTLGLGSKRMTDSAG